MHPDTFNNNRGGSCYNCGSTIRGHHTLSCTFSSKKDKRDLPEIPGTQWWVECKDALGNWVDADRRPRLLHR